MLIIISLNLNHNTESFAFAYDDDIGDLQLSQEKTEPENGNIRELTAPQSLWPGKFTTTLIYIYPSEESLQARIEALDKNQEYAEPISLKINTQDLLAVQRQIGKDSYTGKVKELLQNNTSQNTYLNNLAIRLKTKRIKLEPGDLNWLDLKKLSRTLKVSSLQPSIAAKDWQTLLNDSETNFRLEEFFGSGDLTNITRNIESWLGENPGEAQIPLQILLPEHMRSLFGKFSYLRGRNCFATALEFATPGVTKLKNIKVATQQNHYISMINSDELSNALWLGYQELSDENILQGLKWGDVVLFYDKAGKGHEAFKHAAVHVGDNVYFQKQSKSADTPIEFTDWNSIVRTWSGFAQSLSYKVYRKLPAENGEFQKPNKMLERIVWTR